MGISLAVHVYVNLGSVKHEPRYKYVHGHVLLHILDSKEHGLQHGRI